MMIGVPTKALPKKICISKSKDALIEDFIFKTLIYFSSPIIKHFVFYRISQILQHWKH
jgi:hypothetical protein